MNAPQVLRIAGGALSSFVALTVFHLSIAEWAVPAFILVAFAAVSASIDEERAVRDARERR